jgi:hypothetical protein
LIGARYFFDAFLNHATPHSWRRYHTLNTTLVACLLFDLIH